MPINVEELREFEGGHLGYYAKGHHDPVAFLEEVELTRCEVGVGFEPVLRPDHVRHEYWRTVPAPDGSGGSLFIVARGPGRGAYPVTVVED